MHDIESNAPHYHFRVFTDGRQLSDTSVLHFPDPEQAWHEGAMAACELIRDMSNRSGRPLDLRMEVSDQFDTLIYRFSFTAERL